MHRYVSPVRCSKTPKNVNILENEVFLVYGLCQFLSCDKGPQFTTKAFRSNLCNRYEVEKILYDVVHSPQCNFVKRTIITAIRSYLENHDTWGSELLFSLLLILRNTIQQAILRLSSYSVDIFLSREILIKCR